MNISNDDYKELEKQRQNANPRFSGQFSYLEPEILGLMMKLGCHDEIKKVYVLDVIENYVPDFIKNKYNLKNENLYIHSKKNLENTFVKNIKNDYLEDPFVENNGNLIKFSVTLGLISFGARNREDYDLIKDTHNRFWRGIPNKSRAEYTYFSHIIETLERNGKAVIFCPTGTLFRQGKEEGIRKHFLEENIIDAIIMLPCKLLRATSIQTSLLVINKNKKNDDILFIDASKDFEETRWINKLRLKDIDKIYNCYKNGEDIIGYSKMVSLQEVENNDFSLSVQQYVKKDEIIEKVDLESLENEILTIENELTKVKNELSVGMKELGGINDKK